MWMLQWNGCLDWWLFGLIYLNHNNRSLCKVNLYNIIAAGEFWKKRKRNKWTQFTGPDVGGNALLWLPEGHTEWQHAALNKAIVMYLAHGSREWKVIDTINVLFLSAWLKPLNTFYWTDYGSGRSGQIMLRWLALSLSDELFRQCSIFSINVLHSSQIKITAGLLTQYRLDIQQVGLEVGSWTWFQLLMMRKTAVGCSVRSFQASLIAGPNLWWEILGVGLNFGRLTNCKVGWSQEGPLKLINKTDRDEYNDCELHLAFWNNPQLAWWIPYWYFLCYVARK